GGRGVGGARARACDRTDAGSRAPTRASGVRYRTRPAAGGAGRAERARAAHMTTIVRLRRGPPWSRATPPCGFPTAASANAVAFRHAAAGWTTATRARPVPRSGAGASDATSPIGAAGPSGGATPRPSARRSRARSSRHQRHVLSDVTLAQPLQVIAFSGAKPPAWAKPHADRPSHDCFTFQVLADRHVRLALVGVREADDAVIVVTKQAATAPRLFRRHA